MIDEYEKRKRKQIALMRSIRDYGFGIFFILIGLLFLLRMKLGPENWVNERLGAPDLPEQIFGGTAIVYGLWRIYRGYQQKYFNY